MQKGAKGMNIYEHLIYVSAYVCILLFDVWIYSDLSNAMSKFLDVQLSLIIEVTQLILEVSQREEWRRDIATDPTFTCCNSWYGTAKGPWAASRALGLARPKTVPPHSVCRSLQMENGNESETARPRGGVFALLRLLASTMKPHNRRGK